MRCKRRLPLTSRLCRHDSGEAAEARLAALLPLLPLGAQRPARKTEVGIRDDGFLINGEPTYKGRSFNGPKRQFFQLVKTITGV